MIPIVDAIKNSDLEAKIRDDIIRLLSDKSYPFRKELETAKSTIFETAKSLDSKQIERDNVSIRNVVPKYGNGEKSKWIIFIPDFMLSELANVAHQNTEVIWYNAENISKGGLSNIKLTPFDGLPEREEFTEAKIRAIGLLKGTYELLLGSLIIEGYSIRSFPYDWTRDLDNSAHELAKTLNDTPFTKSDGNYIIAHGAGALVARRALQILGSEKSRAIIRHLILLAPINCGVFNSVSLLKGFDIIEQLSNLDVVHSKQELLSVFASFAGIYQLIYWDDETLKSNRLDQIEFWSNAPIDDLRLQRYWRWSRLINTKFFDDRTTVFVGYGQATEVSQSGLGDQRKRWLSIKGDGIVKTICSELQGATNYYLELDHFAIPSSEKIIKATSDIIKGIRPELPTEPGVIR